ncbi:Uma2 family endonuclease [Roseateles chitinivorans]|uniref:Uma2 family endonuclease n=1 Tax=Roseateles chitinivorans TaxID=2917965 RepID=UPI003D66B76E
MRHRVSIQVSDKLRTPSKNHGIPFTEAGDLMAYRLPTAAAMQMTSDEFLVWESGDDLRYELIDGQVVIMESASEGHQIVTANILVELRQHVRGTGCRALPGLDVRCDDANCLVPDVLVYCDKDRRSRGMVDCPLLVEVLSPSTAYKDRNIKFARYRGLAALREYMIVDWKRRTTDLHRLAADGSWQVTRYSGKEVVYLASIDLALPGEVIFDDLDHAA